MPWLAFLALAILLGLMAYWLLIITEGVFLGYRMVVWLYDLTAGNYDRIKQFEPSDEWQTIGQPLMAEIATRPEPLVLDVATGTGRLPLLLLTEAGFSGRIIGLDPAIKMLRLAQQKIEKLPVGRQARCGLVQQSASALPFPGHTFDGVTCLEALEFMPSAETALDEMARVLKPGGFLMTTRRRGWQARLFFGRHRSREQFALSLAEKGFSEVNFYLWQLDYDMVTARKRNDPNS